MMDYVNLLQNHIAKENNILFRMADQVFSSEKQNLLLDKFAILDENTEIEFNAEKSIAQINNLAAIYLF
jgi:hemerythrin-like domain-containing protein